MSHAFVKEQDPDAPVVLPDKPISEHINYVTLKGYELLCSKKSTLEGELHALLTSEGLNVKNKVAEIKRDIRYLNSRIESANKVGKTDTDSVRFGCIVSFVDEEETQYRYQIVGEDEADAKIQKISWTSPLARTLIGKSTGELGVWIKSGEHIKIEIVDITSQPERA